jgi:transcriptional regulator GlxA family with amidase domain
VIATSHLFDWDRDRLTACGGMAVTDLLLAVLARDHGAELAGAVSEELVVERIREGASASAFRCRTAWVPAIRS